MSREAWTARQPREQVRMTATGPTAPPSLLTREPPPELLDLHVPPVPISQHLVVQNDAPVAGLTERAEGERLVISPGAEDDGAGGLRHGVGTCSAVTRLVVRPGS